MNAASCRASHVMRFFLFVFICLLPLAFAVSTNAQTTPVQVAQGSGTLTAPGYNNQDYVISNIDTTKFAYGGTLQINITLGSGVSSGSFDLFPQGFTIPTVGRPYGTLGGAYDISPGSMAQITVQFAQGGGQIFQFGATGNWFSQVGTTNTYSFTATVTPNPPPLATITVGKLGIPTFERQPDNSVDYIIPVYFKSQNEGDVAGQLLIDNVPYLTKDFGDIFAPGIWQEGTIHVPRSMFLGSKSEASHTIQFVFSVNQLSTGIASVSDIGFDPALNGWQFTNGDYDKNQGKTSGFCLGLSLVDQSYYQNYKPQSFIPQLYKTPANLPVMVKFKINSTHTSANKNQAPFTDFHDRLQSYQTGSDQLSVESGLLETPLTEGNPSVMLLYPFPFGNFIKSIIYPSHAVVAFIAVDIDNGYIETSPDTSGTIRSFYVYDSNVPGHGNTIELDNIGGVFKMQPYESYIYLAASDGLN